MAPGLSFLTLLLTVIRLGATDNESMRDESKCSSDIIERMNHDIKTPLIHGDIALNAVSCTAAGCLWPKVNGIVEVPYKFSRDFTKTERRLIKRSLKVFAESTCVRFIRKRKRQQDYIYFVPESGCWSYLGRVSGQQKISLEKRGCLHKDIVQHEALHALGFHHEQVRSDRDENVRILFENVIPGLESQFQKVETNNLGTSYDFNSVMHYGKFAFTRNGLPTIEALTDPDLPLGQAREMNDNDIRRVNLLYECEN